LRTFGSLRPMAKKKKDCKKDFIARDEIPTGRKEDRGGRENSYPYTRIRDSSPIVFKGRKIKGGRIRGGDKLAGFSFKGGKKCNFRK